MKRTEILAELKRLIQSKNNDAVKLAYLGEEAAVNIGRLDLRGLVELKRSEKGCFEVKFVDRLKALELMARLTECESEEDLTAFFEGLRGEDGA